MAQVEDHVARNLSQLPDFGVELSSMEFTSVRAFLRLSQVFVFMAGKSNWMWLLIYLCPFFKKKNKKKILSCDETSGWTGWWKFETLEIAGNRSQRILSRSWPIWPSGCSLSSTVSFIFDSYFFKCSILALSLWFFPTNFNRISYSYAARRVGGRFKYLWLATIFHGLTVECAAYWLPDIDNFWHSQTTIVLLGRRLPIHIMMLCSPLYKLIDLWLFFLIIILNCWLQTLRLSITLPWLYHASNCLAGLNHLQVIILI